MSRGYWTHLSLSVCLDLRHSLCHSPSVAVSNFKQNYTFPFTSFFFISSAYSSPACQSQTPWESTQRHTYALPTCVHTQLHAITRHKKVFKTWDSLARVIYQIHRNSCSTDVYKAAKWDCVCERTRRASPCLRCTCVLSQLYQFSETFAIVVIPANANVFLIIRNRWTQRLKHEQLLRASSQITHWSRHNCWRGSNQT